MVPLDITSRLIQAGGSFGIYLAIVAPVIAYGAIKYLHGPTPEVRREGLDAIMDALIGAVMMLALYAVLLGSSLMVTVVKSLGSAVTVQVSNKTVSLAQYIPTGSTAQGLLQWSYGTAHEYFLSVANNYGWFWKEVLALSVVPTTSPLGWYLQQATWYWQTMVTYTLINLGFLYALSLIAYYAWLVLPTGVGLMIIRQTRSVGAFIVVFLMINAVLDPLLTAYTAAYLGTVGITASGNAINLLDWFISNGYNQGLVLQTYDVTVDVVLAFALAVSYGLFRVFDEVMMDVLPL